MPAFLAGIRFPYTRVLLPRTRLAYVHLRNLLTDAKRDRAARVAGYVAIWLPEELLILYLSDGELFNATVGDASGWRGLPLAQALDKVPSEPEYGEICFHEAPEEQLAAMFMSQTIGTEPWPAGLDAHDPGKVFPYLMATTFDGVIEIAATDTLNYLIFQNGTVERAFIAAGGEGTVVERVTRLFAREGKDVQLRRWPGHLVLPVQVAPQLVAAYRELAQGVVQRLVDGGRSAAPKIAEQARQNLLTSYPELDAISFNGRVPSDPLCDGDCLTEAVAALVQEVLWTAADHESQPPEQILKELTWPRRHMFQSAGLYERLPWKVI